jgi:hypothetical protein
MAEKCQIIIISFIKILSINIASEAMRDLRPQILINLTCKEDSIFPKNSTFFLNKKTM